MRSWHFVYVNSGASHPHNDGSCACAERSPPPDGQRSSQLLARQLQDFWKKSRNTLVPQRLLFEVTSANVVKDPPSKYVVSEVPGTLEQRV